MLFSKDLNPDKLQKASDIQTKKFYTPDEYVASILPAFAARAGDKPTVHYSVRIGDLAIGLQASLIPIDHPAVYLNGDLVTTSYIVAIDGDNFETRNTRYVYQPK